MNDEIFFDDKNINNNNRKYLYFGIMGLFLLVGVSYAIIFFMEKFESEPLGMQTDLLDVAITENGLVTIDEAITQKDSDGIKNDKSTFTIKNNNAVPIRVIMKLVEDHNSTLDINAIRYGVLGGGEILNVGNLGESEGILYDFFMEPGQTAVLQSTLWLDYFYEGGDISEVFSAKYVVEASNADQFAYMYLTNLVNRDKGLYAINDDGTLNNGSGNIKEYRYSGLNPDNYVYFNNELWRIISLSNGILKIVKNEEISLDSYVGNEIYFNNLDEVYQEYVLNATFNTGSIYLTDTYTSLLTNESSSTTEGYINYISASDYLYSTEPTYYVNALNDTNVSSNTWLTGTYLTANSIGENNILGINANVPTSASSTDENYNIRPCLYLKKSVSIVEGNGTIEKPYVLDYADVKELPAMISYDLNGGTGDITSNKVTEGITSVVPTKEGYVFKGWSTTKNGEVEYQSGDTYTGGMILLYAVWEEPPKAAEEIIEKVVAYSVSSPTTFTGGLVGVNTDGLLYNEADENQQVREYRYSGPNVNNYIYFNCKDNDGTYNYGDVNYNYNEMNCELWRIVGIFKNSDGEWNLKLMRNKVLQASELVSTYTYNGTTYNIQYGTDNKVYWNKKSSGTNNNDWTTAGLQYFLNTNKDSNDVAGYYSTIKDTSKVLIDENYTYYLGNVVYDSDTTLSAYTNERDANNKHSGNQSSWPGAIALLYPSDYGYSAHSINWKSKQLYGYNGTPKNSNWMMNDANHSANEWLLSPSSNGSHNAFYWYSSGELVNYSVNYGYYGARPVLNLKSETTRLKGDGTSESPYVVIGN